MTSLAGYVTIFTAVGVGFVAVNLTLGRLFRPNNMDAEKATVYECGEPTVGSAWVQFDLRFYVVALLFVIFDVEMAFFFPWAVVFGQAVRAGDSADNPAVRAGMRSLAWVAFYDILIFFGTLLVGFAYLWKRGDLDWVRSLAAHAAEPPRETGADPLERRVRELVVVSNDSPILTGRRASEG